MSEWIEIELSRIIMQQKGDQQYLHLRERDGNRTFPIVIGFNEIEEINRKLRGISAPRPLTHDLIGRVLRTLDHDLVRVVINELRDSTFFANLVLRPKDGSPKDGSDDKLVDCRPSDAIALAVQLDTPIYVARDVFDAVSPQA